MLRDKQNKAEWSRFKKYGIVKSDYLALKEKQNHKCAICEAEEVNLKTGLLVDHDHDTGAVRGLLCHHCNAGIGMLRDNITVMKSAIEYLKKSKKG